MEVKESKNEIKTLPASNLNVPAKQNLTDLAEGFLFLEPVASAPTAKPNYWFQRLKVKSDGTALYIWTGSEWKTATLT